MVSFLSLLLYVSNTKLCIFLLRFPVGYYMVKYNMNVHTVMRKIIYYGNCFYVPLVQQDKSNASKGKKTAVSASAGSGHDK